jgi:hypothetical protein
MSALYSLTCISLLRALSTIDGLSELCNQCIKYYLFDLPKSFETYVNPSILWCSTFMRDPSS